MQEFLKILMLEDSAADAEIIQRFLIKEKLCCEFRLAIDKEEYLIALDQFKPDVILSDHSFPQFNSREALVIARQRFPKIPFILITGAVSEEFAVDILKSGADDYILKDRLARLPISIVTAIQLRKSEKEKSESEQKTKLSETNLRTIFENTSEGFLLMDKNAIVTAFNNKAGKYHLFSHEKEIQIGYSIYDFIKEERKIFFQQIIEKALSGDSIQYDRAYDMENGNTSWIEFSVTPVKESNQIKGICITGRDITEKKIIEQEREFDRNNLKALINNTNDPMWSVDRNFNLITSNAAFDKMVEVMTSGNRITKGDNIFGIGFGKDQLDRFHKYYDRAFSGESFMEIEYSSIPNDYWSEISFYPIYHENTVIGVSCFSHDITWRKKAEKEITDYKNALDKSSIVSITDEDGIIKYVNDNFCTISGYQAVELTGHDYRIINSGYHSPAFMEDLWSKISAGKVWRGEFCNKAKDGSLYWVDATIVPFLNDKGEPTQYIEITNDITQKKLIEQELVNQKIQEQKKIARAIISAEEKERNYIGQELHDNINQILATARLFLGIAKNKSAEVNELIKYPIELLDCTVEEIRLLSQKLVTPLKNKNLDDLIQRLLDDITADKGIVTNFEYNLSNLIIRDNLVLNIYRIIQEQLNNISKHAAAEKVDISIQADDGLISIVVADNGKGFDVNKARKGIGISNMMNRIESFNG
ncbi:MAG TPA: PAS domain S-box protein, partial [Cytophaga sp.]|nr:PAS domain S-box protein [Cytophaga sp.]